MFYHEPRSSREFLFRYSAIFASGIRPFLTRMRVAGDTATIVPSLVTQPTVTRGYGCSELPVVSYECLLPFHHQGTKFVYLRFGKVPM